MSCTCTFSQRLVGDGCSICNPKLALEFARETISDQRQEIERLRTALLSIANAALLEVSEEQRVARAALEQEP